MAVAGWIVDKSAAARRATDATVADQLNELASQLNLFPAARLEQLYSAQSAREYEDLQQTLNVTFRLATAPRDILDRALALQRDLAHHHGMWHRIPIPDLIIAETALFHGHGVLHVDADYDRIAEVRPLVARRLG